MQVGTGPFMDFNKYIITAERPEAAAFTYYYVYKSEVTYLKHGSATDLLVFASSRISLSDNASVEDLIRELAISGFVVDVFFDSPAYLIAMSEFKHKLAELLAKFKFDLILECGATQNPLASSWFAKAWESQRLQGLEAVYQSFLDFQNDSSKLA